MGKTSLNVVEKKTMKFKRKSERNLAGHTVQHMRVFLLALCACMQIKIKRTILKTNEMARVSYIAFIRIY